MGWPGDRELPAEAVVFEIPNPGERVRALLAEVILKPPHDSSTIIGDRDLSPFDSAQSRDFRRTKLRDTAGYLAAATFAFGKKLFFTLATIT